MCCKKNLCVSWIFFKIARGNASVRLPFGRPFCHLQHKNFFSQQAFTLMELMAVMVIIAILSILIFEGAQQMREHTDGIICMGNLRSLHVALNIYVQDQKHWPQVIDSKDTDAMAEWWINALKNYGMTNASWHCPSYERQYLADKNNPPDKPRIAYIPTHFDAKPSTPFLSPQMPWAIEVGDFHGKGNLILFPDGSVQDFHTIYKEATGHGW